MIQFRDVPQHSDYARHTAPPSTWPASIPAFAKEEHVQALIEADWAPWWGDVANHYPKTLASPRRIGMRGLAHALALEQKNGWSFDFCLSYCEEHLTETAGGLAASLTMRHLTSRARSNADEVLAGAAANAIAAEDGFHFQGDLGRLVRERPGLVSRRWTGNGPDYLVARVNYRSGDVAEFRFIEAKGVAGKLPEAMPKCFYKFKTQSLNADLSNSCICKPILSYAYLPLPKRQPRPRHGKPAPVPASQAPIPMVVQWFNATERRPDEPTYEHQRDSALLILTLARDQFHRLLWKSGLPGGANMGTLEVAAFARPSWLFPFRLKSEWWFISQDHTWAITIPLKSVQFFNRVNRLLAGITDLERVDGYVLYRLLAAMRDLGRLTDGPQFPEFEYIYVNNLRFERLVRDPTGITFLSGPSRPNRSRQG